MYIDVLSSSNYLSLNIPMVRLLGLEAAAYWSVLLQIIEKAVSKNKVDSDGFFKVDRKYIFNKTTVSPETQLKIDAELKKLSVLRQKEDDTDTIWIDLKMMYSILISDDFEFAKSLVKKVSAKVNKEARKSERQSIIANLKDHIMQLNLNYELTTAYRSWVDEIFSKPRGYLSNKIIDIFVQKLTSYCKDDTQLNLKLIDVAIVHGWRDADWVINSYEKDNKLIARSSSLFTGQQVVATDATVSKKVY